MNLANNIRILRKNTNMPQEELAEKLNVSRQVVSKWETGKSDPPLETLISIAEYFGITLDELVRSVIPPKNPFLFSSKPNTQEEYYMSNNTVLTNVKMLDSINVDICNRKDEGLFPRVSPEKVSAYNKFSHAYDLDIKSDQTNDAEKRVEAMHLYLEAFDEGVKEAAVNMLRVLTNILFNIRGQARENKFPFQDRIEYFLEGLEEIDSQEGRYYHSLLLLYGLLNTGDSEDDNMDKGFQMMYELEDEGFEYAIRFVREKIKHNE